MASSPGFDLPIGLMSGITPFLNVLDTKPGPWRPLGSSPGCMLCPLFQTRAAQGFLCLRSTLAPLMLALVLRASCRALDPILLEQDSGAEPLSLSIQGTQSL